MGILDRILRAGEGKRLKALAGLVPDINAYEAEMKALSDTDLQAKTPEFRQRLENGEDLDDLLVEAFAAMREAASRVIGQRHFDVQLMGGAALHFGWIAEMKTGEGKTLVSTLPAYLNGLTGKGLHLVTVNDYLARRDAEWMGQIHRWMGLSVGLVIPGLRERPAEKRLDYACDITYGTNNEVGFDYLRDNMATQAADKVQRGHVYAIVDEVDSILIDEARTPLIISGRVADAAKLYYRFASVVRSLRRDVDYEVDEEKRSVFPTETGIERVERELAVENLYDAVQQNLVHQLQAALRAKELYKRDKDYIVQAGEVKIVDEFTGRILEGRRWSEGLHQAVEAKEGVKIKEENQTLATITLQNYFRMYDKLAGMTGTATTESAELMNTYDLQVVPIPTNMPVVRADEADLIYKGELGKFDAVVEDLEARVRDGPAGARRHRQRGQERVPGFAADEAGHPPPGAERQAAHAGGARRRPGRPAGLGHGGDQHGRSRRRHHARRQSRGSGPRGGPEGGPRARDARGGVQPPGAPGRHARGLPGGAAQPRRPATWSCWSSFRDECGAEGDKVRELGGLYVLGTERHESRRIDNQLRGRAGRQGDPGESRFYLSLDDELMRLFATGALQWVMGKTLPDDAPIEAKMVTKAIERAQNTVEQRNGEIRKNVLKYDEVMNEQRKVIYRRRDQILAGADLRTEALEYLDDAVRTTIEAHCVAEVPEEWDLEGLQAELQTFYPSAITVEQLGRVPSTDAMQILVMEEAEAYYQRREQELTPEVMREVERQVMLQIIDQRWREHLQEMDYLQEGINLRAMGQRDPLVEWQREGFEMFGQLMHGIAQDFVRYVMHVQVVQPAEQTAAPAVLDVATHSAEDDTTTALQAAAQQAVADGELPAEEFVQDEAAPVAAGAQGGGRGSGAGPGTQAATRTKQQTVVNDEWSKTGRNEPCPCGSGKKYKLCHGR